MDQVTKKAKKTKGTSKVNLPAALQEIETLRKASCQKQDELWTTLREQIQRSERTISDDNDRNDDDVGNAYILESSILENLRCIEDGLRRLSAGVSVRGDSAEVVDLMRKDPEKRSVLRSLTQHGPACIAQAYQEHLPIYREILWPEQEIYFDHRTVASIYSDDPLEYFTEEPSENLEDLFDKLQALYSSKGRCLVTYLEDYRWDIHDDPSEKRILCGMHPEERLFDGPVLLELPNAEGTMYRKAVRERTVKATLFAIYTFYQAHQREGHTMGYVTCVQHLKQAERGNPYLWRLELAAKKHCSNSLDLLRSKQQEWQRSPQYKNKTSLRKYSVEQDQTYEYDVAFEDMIWDFSKMPTEETVSEQDLSEVLFDGPVLLRLFDIEQKVMGLVPLYGRKAKHALRAIHKFYSSHRPYRDGAEFDSSEWAVGLSCDKRHVWDVFLDPQ